VRFTGEVESVAPFYAAAKVVVLPIRFGTGLAVKTVDALSHGVAFVATRAALRGFSSNDLASYGIPSTDEPRAFAREVELLLSDPKARMCRRMAGRQFAYAVCSPEIYRSRWDDIIRAACGRDTRADDGLPEFTRPCPVADLDIEWSDDERLLARAIKHVVGAGAWCEEDARMFRSRWIQAPDARRRIPERIARTRHAPLAIRRADLREAIERTGTHVVLERLFAI
jgi:hypothetical protein